MGYRSGLGAQLGFAAETTPGTAVTVTKFVEFLQESIEFKVERVRSEDLRKDLGYARLSRSVKSRFTVDGDVEMSAWDRNIGLLLAQLTGSTPTPTQIASSTAYKTIFNPGSSGQAGKALTVQIGRPYRASSNADPSTCRGMKIPSWEFSASDNAPAKWKFSFDGWRATRSTGLAAASFVSGTAPFIHRECAVRYDVSQSNASLVSNEITLASPSSLASTTVLKSINIKGNTPLDTQAFGIGNAGVKSEQIENAIGSVMIDLDIEHSVTEGFQDALDDGSSTDYFTGWTFDFTHGDAGSSNPFRCKFAFPAARVLTYAPTVQGPDVVRAKMTLEALDPEITNMGLYQIVTVNNQTTL